MAAKLEAIIFDIGNVLLRFDFNRTLTRIAPYCETEFNRILPRLEPLKHYFESGQISNDAFLDQATALLGYKGSRAELISAWEEIFEPIAATHDLVTQLKNRIPMYLLSNTNAIHCRYFLSMYPLFNFFKNAVYSHRVQMAKPDPEIYEYAMVEFGVNPYRTLFIDDLAANVKAAKERGFHAHQYSEEQHGDLQKVLRSFGIEVYGLDD